MPRTVEVRVPTYRRPRLLRRALQSVQSQTHENWRCIVFDDSPKREAELVCRELADERIVYRPNPQNLGAGRNIDQAFRKQPYLEGDVFCVVEDDNYLLPKFLEANLRVMSDTGATVVQRNQWMEQNARGENPGELDGTIFEGIMSERLWPAEQFKAALFVRRGISNGGLMWAGNCQSDFETGCADPILQETQRTFLLVDPIYLALEPLAVWRANGGETSRAQGSYREFLSTSREIQTMCMKIYDDLKASGKLGVLRGDDFRLPPPKLEEGVWRSLRRWPGPSTISVQRRLALLAKAAVLRWSPV